MAELLLELFSEEIPAGMQQYAASYLKRGVEDKLKAHKVSFSGMDAYATPMRLTLVVKGLPKEVGGERRGPRVGAPEQAIEGFLKSAGITKKQLKKKKTDKGEFYFAVFDKQDKNIESVFVEVLEGVIKGFAWPKQMRWGAYDISWVRPLHNILCLFDGKVVPVKFGKFEANNKTKGHRFLSNGEYFVVKDSADYKQKLADESVVLDFGERRGIIQADVRKVAQSKKLEWKEDNELLNEVAGLVEYPVVLVGKIGDDFMHLPDEVLITSMRTHQKYFSVVNSKGELAPYFIVVANIDGGKVVTDGNERVLRARLADALFFWDQDKKRDLFSRVPDLKKVVFHAKLGTVADKVGRLEELSKVICLWVRGANLVLAEKAATLCKVDLTTEMVAEFPELQGIMGSYYAREMKEDEQVADAILAHYKPQGPHDEVPVAPLSIVLSPADKIDSLVGLFLIGEKPSGSNCVYNSSSSPCRNKSFFGSPRYDTSSFFSSATTIFVARL